MATLLIVSMKWLRRAFLARLSDQIQVKIRLLAKPTFVDEKGIGYRVTRFGHRWLSCYSKPTSTQIPKHFIHPKLTI